MLGLILIYFIGKVFYDLAGEYNKHQWGFGILGVVTYYSGTFVGGFGLASYANATGWYEFFELENLVLGFMLLPFGLLACVILYFSLKNFWKRKKIEEGVDILDKEFMD